MERGGAGMGRGRSRGGDVGGVYKLRFVLWCWVWQGAFGFLDIIGILSFRFILHFVRDGE